MIHEYDRYAVHERLCRERMTDPLFDADDGHWVFDFRSFLIGVAAAVTAYFVAAGSVP